MDNMNENMGQNKSQASAGCPCMSMNKKYAEGFKSSDMNKNASSASTTASDGAASSEDELDILEIEEDEFE